jgi:hypothetical protein
VRFCIVLFTTCWTLTGTAFAQDQAAPDVSTHDPSLPAAPAQDQSTDEWLRIYAVEINDLSGIYIGKGLVITAAHVVGPVGTRLRLGIAGQEMEGQVVKAGKFEDVDLSLLSVDASKLPIWLQMRRIEFCAKPLTVGQPVIVAVPRSTARSVIASPMLLSPEYRKKFSTLIRDVATTGNSGSGVFAAGRKCFLGIMSLKFIASPKDGEGAPRDIAKYFVPAATIWEFVPPWYRSALTR